MTLNPFKPIENPKTRLKNDHSHLILPHNVHCSRPTVLLKQDRYVAMPAHNIRSRTEFSTYPYPGKKFSHYGKSENLSQK